MTAMERARSSWPEGLLDHAAHLTARGDDQAAATATGEAARIAAQLGC